MLGDKRSYKQGHVIMVWRDQHVGYLELWQGSAGHTWTIGDGRRNCKSPTFNFQKQFWAKLREASFEGCHLIFEYRMSGVRVCVCVP